MRLTKDLRKYATILGLDVLGLCPSESLNNTPQDRKPHTYLKNARSIISIGYKLNLSAVNNLPGTRSAYMLEHDYANRHLDKSSYKIARFLEEKGHSAVGFDSGAGFYHVIGNMPEILVGDISHKHAAVACGLGSSA